MLFGRDLQTNLQNTVKINCGNNIDAQCFNNINNVLETDQDESVIQRRGVAIYGTKAFGPVVAAFEAVYSALIFLWVMKSASNHPLHIHLPSNVLGQIGAATKLNTAVIKTAANDASPVTVTISTATTTTTTSSSSATASAMACVEDDVTKMVKSALEYNVLQESTNSS